MNLLKHRFVSAKTDGPDLTQIQPSNWNDGHAFSGGAAGDVLTRDPTDAMFGAAWVPPKSPVYNGTISATTVTVPPGYPSYMLTNIAADNVLYGVLPTTGTIPPGVRLTILNQAGTALTLAHNSAAVGGGKLFNFSTGPYATRLAPWAGTVGGTVTYVADGQNNWLIVSHEQGGWASLGMGAGNVGGGALLSMLRDWYQLRGRDAHVSIFANIQIAPGGSDSVRFAVFPFSFDGVASFGPSGAGSSTATSGWGPAMVHMINEFTVDIKPPANARFAEGPLWVSLDMSFFIL